MGVAAGLEILRRELSLQTAAATSSGSRRLLAERRRCGRGQAVLRGRRRGHRGPAALAAGRLRGARAHGVGSGGLGRAREALLTGTVRSQRPRRATRLAARRTRRAVVGDVREIASSVSASSASGSDASSRSSRSRVSSEMCARTVKPRAISSVSARERAAQGAVEERHEACDLVQPVTQRGGLEVLRATPATTWSASSMHSRGEAGAGPPHGRVARRRRAGTSASDRPRRARRPPAVPGRASRRASSTRSTRRHSSSSASASEAARWLRPRASRTSRSVSSTARDEQIAVDAGHRRRHVPGRPHVPPDVRERDAHVLVVGASPGWWPSRRHERHDSRTPHAAARPERVACADRIEDQWRPSSVMTELDCRRRPRARCGSSPSGEPLPAEVAERFMEAVLDGEVTPGPAGRRARRPARCAVRRPASWPGSCGPCDRDAPWPCERRRAPSTPAAPGATCAARSTSRPPLAIVVAAAGVPVAKAGNRAVSSQAGSSDVMAALGLRVEQSPAEAEASLRKDGFAYLHAPAFHPGMRHAGPVRRELGRPDGLQPRSGPLANPARPRRQLVGVPGRGRGVERALGVSSSSARSEPSSSRGERLDELPLDGSGVIFDVIAGRHRASRRCASCRPRPRGGGHGRLRRRRRRRQRRAHPWPSSRVRRPGTGPRCRGPQRGASLFVAGRVADLRQGVELAMDDHRLGRGCRPARAAPRRCANAAAIRPTVRRSRSP